MQLKWRKIQIKKKAKDVCYHTKHLTDMASLSHTIPLIPPPPYKSPLLSMLLTKSHPTAREHSIAENVAAHRYLQRATESFERTQLQSNNTRIESKNIQNTLHITAKTYVCISYPLFMELMRDSSTSAAGLCQVRLSQSHRKDFSHILRQSLFFREVGPRWMDLWLSLCSLTEGLQRGFYDCAH